MTDGDTESQKWGHKKSQWPALRIFRKPLRYLLHKYINNLCIIRFHWEKLWDVVTFSKKKTKKKTWILTQIFQNKCWVEKVCWSDERNSGLPTYLIYWIFSARTSSIYRMSLISLLTLHLSPPSSPSADLSVFGTPALKRTDSNGHAPSWNTHPKCARATQSWPLIIARNFQLLADKSLPIHYLPF